MATKFVEREVRRMEQRVASTEATTRFMLRVQQQTLAKAEELRRLTVKLVKAEKHGTARNVHDMVNDLDRFLSTLQPFNKKWTKAQTRKIAAFLRGARK